MKSNPSILILCLTCAWDAYPRLRNAQRKTWDSLNWPGVLTTRFYHGQHQDAKPEPDLLILPVQDRYENLFVLLQQAIEASLSLEWTWMFRTNASSYVCKRRLLEFARTELPQTSCYCGISGNDYLDGSGFFLSRDVAKKLVEMPGVSLPDGIAEDVYIGRELTASGVEQRKGQRHDFYFSPGNLPDVYHYRCKYGLNEDPEREKEIHAFGTIFETKKHLYEPPSI